MDAQGGCLRGGAQRGCARSSLAGPCNLRSRMPWCGARHIMAPSIESPAMNPLIGIGLRPRTTTRSATPCPEWAGLRYTAKTTSERHSQGFEVLAELARHYPVSLHGVGMSLGSADPPRCRAPAPAGSPGGGHLAGAGVGAPELGQHRRALFQRSAAHALHPGRSFAHERQDRSGAADTGQTTAHRESLLLPATGGEMGRPSFWPSWLGAAVAASCSISTTSM